MSKPLPWHDEAEILGVRVRVHCFDPVEAEVRADTAARLLPVFAGHLPVLQTDAQARTRFEVGALSACPAAVFAHGGGLICLTRGDRRPRDRDNWRALFRVDSMLQALATAMAVAGQRQLPTAALLRDAGALYQLDPGSAVLECLASHIGDACCHWQVASVSPAQLASFCEPRLRMLPGVRGPVLAADAVST